MGIETGMRSDSHAGFFMPGIGLNSVTPVPICGGMRLAVGPRSRYRRDKACFEMNLPTDSIPLEPSYTEITESTRCGGRTKERDVTAKGFDGTDRIGWKQFGTSGGNRAKGAGHDEIICEGSESVQE